MHNYLENHNKNIDYHDIFYKLLLTFENIQEFSICRKYWLFFKVSQHYSFYNISMLQAQYVFWHAKVPTSPLSPMLKALKYTATDEIDPKLANSSQD